MKSAHKARKKPCAQSGRVEEGRDGIKGLKRGGQARDGMEGEDTRGKGGKKKESFVSSSLCLIA